jgi:hypothetical protein
VSKGDWTKYDVQTTPVEAVPNRAFRDDIPDKTPALLLIEQFLASDADVWEGFLEDGPVAWAVVKDTQALLARLRVEADNLGLGDKLQFNLRTKLVEKGPEYKWLCRFYMSKV